VVAQSSIVVISEELSRPTDRTVFRRPPFQMVGCSVAGVMSVGCLSSFPLRKVALARLC
jgi:hypothetical protein